MIFFIPYVVLLLFFKFCSGLQISFNLHDTGGPFPNIIKVIVTCDESSKNDTGQKVETQNIPLPDNLDLQRIPISRNYGNLLINDIKVNSTGRFRCTLVTPVPHSYQDEVKTRVKRALQASIPAEYGTCRPGYSLVSYDRCFPCHPGSYSSGTSSQCLPCPKNFYGPLPAQDSCYACPKGSVTSSQGADTEDACIYLDDKGQPLPKISTKAIVIITCAAIFIASVIIAFLVWYFWLNKLTKPKKPKPRKARPEIIKFDQSPLFMKDSGPFYRQASNSDEHIYAEISEEGYDSDLYLEPKKPKDDIYTEIIDSDSHIYEEPIKLKHVAISHDSFYCERPELLQYARNKYYPRKPIEGNTRFEQKRKLMNSKKPLKKVIELPKGKLNEGKRVYRHSYNENPNYVEVAFHTRGSELELNQLSCQHTETRPDLEKLSEVIDNRRKRISEDVNEHASDESEIEREEITRLLKNIFKYAKYCVDSKEAATGAERVQPVDSKITPLSDEHLIEMNPDSTEPKIETLQITTDKILNIIEDSEKISRDSEYQQTAINNLKTPDLPEVIDSNIYLADIINQ